MSIRSLRVLRWPRFEKRINAKYGMSNLQIYGCTSMMCIVAGRSVVQAGAVGTPTRYSYNYIIRPGQSTA